MTSLVTKDSAEEGMGGDPFNFDLNDIFENFSVGTHLVEEELDDLQVHHLAKTKKLFLT